METVEHSYLAGGNCQYTAAYTCEVQLTVKIFFEKSKTNAGLFSTYVITGHIELNKPFVYLYCIIIL